MRNLMFLLFSLFLLTGSMACKTDELTIPETKLETNKDTLGSRLRIRIGSKTFIATLLGNPTVTAFKARLPMQISMSELNGNEKLFNFPENLPTSSSNPKMISSGDLMIYSSNVLVLFYKSFPTSYSYTRLGRMVDTVGLQAAVGSGNVTVTFELE